jgi:hypothetical protein
MSKALVHSPLESIDKLITINGMNLPESTDFDTWAKMGEGIGLSRKLSKKGSLMLCVGDWLNYSEKNQFAASGEAYSQALEATGYSQNTLYQAKYVCGAVPPERRHMDADNITFSHLVAIAPLNPEQQSAFLEIAVQDKLTAAKLKTMVGGIETNGAEQHEEGEAFAEEGEAPTPAERIRSTLDRVQDDMGSARMKAEEFFTMATAFIDTLAESGSVDNETIANVQASAKTLAEVCNRVFKGLGSLLN